MGTSLALLTGMSEGADEGQVNILRCKRADWPQVLKIEWRNVNPSAGDPETLDDTL